jgi:preprotein translocase subunit YajC
VIIGASNSGTGFIFLIVVLFAVVWLIFVRPQKSRQRKQQQMVNELRVGDEVLTAGGIYGTISQLDDDQVTVEIAPKTEVRVARRAIAGVTREPEEEPEEPDETEDPEAEPTVDPSGAIPGADTSDEESRG